MNRQILLVGLGEFGCAVADAFARTARPEDGIVHALAIDTDARTAERIGTAPFLSLAYPCLMSDVLDILNTDLIKTWFPCDRENECIEYFEMLSMNEGANQWRMKALLSFYYFLSRPKAVSRLEGLLAPILRDASENGATDLEIRLVSSLAGGTGSGLLLPISLYLKRYFSEYGFASVNVACLLALPDVCEDLMTREQQIKARANAYATLRELHAITQNAFDPSVALSFRIGSSNDPVMGVLFDTEDPKYHSPEALPFVRIHLYRRRPGIRSLTPQISAVADILHSLCNGDPLTKPENSAIYAGISLNKSIYPAEDLLSYIAQHYLCDIADGEWLPFYRQANARYQRLLAKRDEHDDRKDRTGALLAEAIVTFADELRASPDSKKGTGDKAIRPVRRSLPSSGSDPTTTAEADIDENIDENNVALLSRAITDTKSSFIPSRILPDTYIKTLNTAIYNGLSGEQDDQIAETLQKYRAPLPQKGKKVKKPREPFLGRDRRKVTLLRLARATYARLDACYRTGHEQVGTITQYTNLLTDPTSPLCLDSFLLSEDGTALHPIFAFARLASLYRALEESVADRREDIKKKQHLLSPNSIPDWLLEASAEVHMDCRYDRGGITRFIDLMEGDRTFAGGKLADLRLFCIDLENCYTRMRTAFRDEIVEGILPVIAKRLKAYDRLFGCLSEILDDHKQRLKELTVRSSSRLGDLYYVAATPEEKASLYRSYLETVKDTPQELLFSQQLALELGHGMLSLLSATDKEDDALRGTEVVMKHLLVRIHENCHASDFYHTVINKNIMSALLSQNGQNGADSADLALSRAFSSGTEPLVYTLPDRHDTYVYARTIQRRVTAILPQEAKEELDKRRALFENKEPNAIVEELLYRAGEYEGQVLFTDTLPAHELRILRETTGLSLSFLDNVSETSEGPLYYKAYQKAISLKVEQCTHLWDPHLMVGVSDETLPRISSD